MSKNVKYAIGIDIGGTFIKFGLVDSEGVIVKKLKKATHANLGVDKVVKVMLEGIKELSAMNLKVKGIGIGSPGSVDSKEGTVETPPNFPEWGKVPLAKLIKNETGLETSIDNDANAAAIGELVFGAGKKHKSFVFVTLGTGVGGGIILKNKIYRGEYGAAGEIGHVSIDMDGALCKCGSKGCIEAYIGNGPIVELAKQRLSDYPNSKIFELMEYDFELLTPKVIGEASELGDECAQSIVTTVGDKLGAALASVCNLLDVGVIIIGGGVSGFGSLLISSTQKSVQSRVLKAISPRIQVLSAKLKNDAGLLGAASLILGD